MTRRDVLKAAASAALAATGLTAFASDKAPIKLLVGFSAGGNVDLVARLLAEELRSELGRNVLVENRPGAGGRLAAQALKAAPADGGTYLFSPDSWAVFPTITMSEAQLRYSYTRDMAPVARVVSYPLGFFASASSGVKSLGDYVAKVRKNPELALYGSSGAGSITEFLGVLMSKEMGTKLTVVPFKGASEVKTMLMGGQVQVGIMSPSDVLAEDSKNIVPLGMIAPRRSALAPQIPTLAEQGVNVTQGSAFMGLWSSSKTPAAERARMEKAIEAIAAKPGFKKKLALAYMESDFAGAQALDKQVRDLLAFWKPVVDASGFKPS
ncbi:MAG: tripartite tricarboxylate transporter substrate-binding protein [Comamonas sp.]